MRLSGAVTVEEMFTHFNNRGVGLIRTSKDTFKLVKDGLNIKSSIQELCNDSDNPGYFVCYESPTTLQLIRRKSNDQQPEQGVMGGMYVLKIIRDGYELSDMI